MSMTNDRLNMLLRLKLEKSASLPIADQDIHNIIDELADGLCEPEFLYDAIAELRRNDEIMIVDIEGVRVAILSRKGRSILDFDKKIINRIGDIINESYIQSVKPATVSE